MKVDHFCRGVILGGLVGDCYGYVYEDKPRVDVSVPMQLLADSRSGISTSQLIYTDDTQMGLATLRSLRAHGRLVPEDLAARYVHDYFSDGSHRYYGGSVSRVFSQLRDSNYQDPYQPAAAQFNGAGSYGNGGAMRASPAALFGLFLPDREFEDLIVGVTRLTHTNPLAICGSLLQAFAVRQLWDLVSKSNQLIPDQFLDRLLDRLKHINWANFGSEATAWESAFGTYENKLSVVKSLLSLSTEPSVDDVVLSLGNDLKAINSVPTALYAFLRSLNPIPNISLTSIPLRCLVYCISLGGDTDTISTMACSLAGGFVGLPTKETAFESPIPTNILARCEGFSVLSEFADWLATRYTT